MKSASSVEKVCCPRFEPEKWDEKIFDWENKKFVKDNVFTALYMPIRFGAVMRRLDKKIEKAGAEIVDNLCLSDHTSKWNMDLFLAVNREIEGLDNVELSGKYLCKVYEGDYKETEKWSADFEKFAESKNYHIIKWYMWYTTCPKCAKKYGENYVAIFGRIA